MGWFVNCCRRITGWMQNASSVLVYCMMLLTVTDIIGRLFGKPVHQSYELTGILGVLVLSFALPKTALDRGNVSIDVLTAKMSRTLKKGIFVLTRIFNIALLAVLTWFVFKKGYALSKTGTVYDVLHIGTFYTLYVLAFACFILMLVFIADIFSVQQEGAQK